MGECRISGGHLVSGECWISGGCQDIWHQPDVPFSPHVCSSPCFADATVIPAIHILHTSCPTRRAFGGSTQTSQAKPKPNWLDLALYWGSQLVDYLLHYFPANQA